MLSTDYAKALAAGSPFDRTRVELFEVLFDVIKDRYFVIRNNRNADEESFRLFSFFESYFSNYIEGTEFDVKEAKAIVDSGIPMPRRDEDSHDILGTFKILSNRAEIMKIPTLPDELFAILSHRHSVLLEGRPHMNPGIFKTKNNRAGMTEFVEHQLVKGTLSQGFKYYAALTDPFTRAIFMINEVHPFNDGNGRIARVMMNADRPVAYHCPDCFSGGLYPCLTKTDPTQRPFGIHQCNDQTPSVQRQSLWNRFHGVKELSCRLQCLLRIVTSETANY